MVEQLNRATEQPERERAISKRAYVIWDEEWAARRQALGALAPSGAGARGSQRFGGATGPSVRPCPNYRVAPVRA